MKKEPLIIMGLLGAVGYAVFHGHRANQDCWLCPYRGWIFLGSSGALGTYLSFTETE